MLNQDLIILILWIVSAGIFAVLWPDKLFKFYIGAVLGFLLFIIANLQIKLLSTTGATSIPTWALDTFILKNKGFVLDFCTILIPVFWVFMTLNQSIQIKVKGWALVSLVFGIILPFFLIGLWTYILTFSAIQLGFLSDILSLISNSKIFDFIKGHLDFVFYFLLFFIFYKIIVTLFIAVMTKIFDTLSEFLWKASAGWGKEEHWENHGHGWGHDSHGWGGHDDHDGGHDDHGHRWHH